MMLKFIKGFKIFRSLRLNRFSYIFSNETMRQFIKLLYLIVTTLLIVPFFVHLNYDFLHRCTEVHAYFIPSSMLKNRTMAQTMWTHGSQWTTDAPVEDQPCLYQCSYTPIMCGGFITIQQCMWSTCMFFTRSFLQVLVEELGQCLANKYELLHHCFIHFF